VPRRTKNDDEVTGENPLQLQQASPRRPPVISVQQRVDDESDENENPNSDDQEEDNVEFVEKVQAPIPNPLPPSPIREPKAQREHRLRTFFKAGSNN